DMAGHTAKNRLATFAWKPAPVQATWLGYFATTGVSAIDYLIADPWTLLPSQEEYFTETVWRLPHTRLCFTRPHEEADVSALPASTNGFVTLGCFNNLAKMTGQVVEVWARVLHALPTARLLLKTAQLDNDSVRADVYRRFERHGIHASRLLLEGQSTRDL